MAQGMESTADRLFVAGDRTAPWARSPARGCVGCSLVTGGRAHRTPAAVCVSGGRKVAPRVGGEATVSARNRAAVMNPLRPVARCDLGLPAAIMKIFGGDHPVTATGAGTAGLDPVPSQQGRDIKCRGPARLPSRKDEAARSRPRDRVTGAHSGDRGRADRLTVFGTRLVARCRDGLGAKGPDAARSTQGSAGGRRRRSASARSCACSRLICSLLSAASARTSSAVRPRNSTEGLSASVPSCHVSQ